MIARVQQALLVVMLLTATAWLVGVWPHSPAWALAGVALVLASHSLALAAEFVWMAAANRRDLSPPATVAQLVRAWWRESATGPQVFFWRQPFFANAVPDYLPLKAPAKLAINTSAALMGSHPASQGLPVTGPVSVGERGPTEPAPLRGVVLVHGLVCNRGFWTPWLQRLRAGNRAFVAVNLEPIFGLIDGYVPQIEDAVLRVTQATGLAPTIVCHSMGGLVARAWLRQAADDSRIHRLITIGSPHHGTDLARFSRGASGAQMRTHSAWLTQLLADEPVARRARYTCWYSNCDNIVFPAATARLPDAQNCFVAGVGHVAMAFHPVVMQACLAEIARS